MGKSCVRFKKLEDVPLNVIGQSIKRVPVKKFIEHYESALKDSLRKRPSNPAVKKAASSKATAKGKKSTKPVAAKKKSRTRRGKND